MVHELGLTPYLVGRSHECDYPPEIQALPVCTAPKFDPNGDSRQVHERVMAILHHALSVYELNLATLHALQPTHILTQAQCEVCAVSLADVTQAVAEWLTPQPGGHLPATPNPGAGVAGYCPGRQTIGSRSGTGITKFAPAHCPGTAGGSGFAQASGTLHRMVRPPDGCGELGAGVGYLGGGTAPFGNGGCPFPLVDLGAGGERRPGCYRGHALWL
jgi:hypothetical protein